MLFAIGLRRIMAHAGKISLAIVLSGCATLPAFGPAADDIVESATFETGADDAIAPYNLVNVSAATVPTARATAGHFPKRFRNQGFLVEQERISVSDVLELRIWESANDGLFAAGGKRETVLSFRVSNAGLIEVPYAGRIKAAGLTTGRVREVLLEKYKGQAIDPEINVRISDTTARAVTVLGNTGNSGRAEIVASGIKLLDLLAQVGGVDQPAWEVQITVSRGRNTGRVWLDWLTANLSNDIVVLPGDTVQITHIPRRYAVYGAVARAGRVSFDTASPSLSDLLAEVGGLNDMQAAPNDVFVFRPSPQLGKPATAYRLDFARPDAFFLADQFMLDQTDIIYVASADASEFRKFVTTLLSPLVGSAAGVQSLGN